MSQIKQMPHVQTDKATTVMNLEARIEGGAKQELRKLRSFEGACLRIPGTLPQEAQIVLQSLFSCFEKAGDVQEGLVGDWLWGFQQCGIHPELTVKGMQALERAGFIRFQAKDNNFVTFQDDAITGAFARYTPKLLDMICEVISLENPPSQ